MKSDTALKTAMASNLSDLASFLDNAGDTAFSSFITIIATGAEADKISSGVVDLVEGLVNSGLVPTPSTDIIWVR